MGLNSIGRVLKVSHVAVQKWVRKYGKKLEEIQSRQEIEIIELDEMHTYVGQKKTIAGYGLLLIDAGKNSSISFWVSETERRLKSCGEK